MKVQPTAWLPLLVAAGVLSAPRARADEPLRLAWDAPAACPGRDQVLAEVARVMGAALHDARPVDARARVRREEEWVVTLTTSRDGETGERVLHAPSCELLVNATALALALALSTSATPPVAPKAAGADAAPTPAPPPAAPPLEERRDAPLAEARAPTSGVEADRGASPPSPRRFAIGGAGVVDATALPRAAVGPALAFGWRPSAVELEVDAAYFLDQHVALADRGTATFRLFAAQARACYALALPVTLLPCATFELGRVSASSTGPQTTSSGALWASPGVAARARWPTDSNVSGFVDTGFAIALSRPEFVVDNIRHVHQSAPFTARLALGLELRL